MKTYILDTCAVIALLNKEQGYEIIAKLYEQAIDNQISLIIHKVNLLEIYYKIYREHDSIKADDIYNKIKNSTIFISDNFDDVVFKAAGYFKAKYKIALGDSFVLGISKKLSAIIVTADNEFKKIEKNEEIEMLWFR
jgi:PIN domain nuclease of toxin-antitoxin system